MKRGDPVLYKLHAISSYWNIGVLLAETKDGYLICTSIWESEDGSIDYKQSITLTNVVKPYEFKEQNATN